MPYFLPSFFQKRLLRYALSRLEFVDTEALDLDSLGITWGHRSVVELRDVALKVDVSPSLSEDLSRLEWDNWLILSFWIRNSRL